MTSIALPIEQSVELNLQYPSVSDRYFTYHYYIPNNSGTKVKSNTHANSVEKIKESLKNNQTLDFCPKGEDSLIMMHSNQICVITLSPKHPIFLQEKSITKVCIWFVYFIALLNFTFLHLQFFGGLLA